jgi:hypothetical protein
MNTGESRRGDDSVAVGAKPSEASHGAGAKASDDALRDAGEAARGAADSIQAGARDAADSIQATAGDVMSQARDVASRAGETVSALAQEAMDEGRDIANVAMQQAEGVVEAQKRAAAGQAEGIVRAIRRAADELQDTTPVMAGYVRDGADYVEDAADALRRRNLRDLVAGAEGFARERPVAFFGAAVLAGFALARFAMSSSEHTPSGSGDAHDRGDAGRGSTVPRSSPSPRPPSTASGAPGWIPGSDDARRHWASGDSHPATVAAATLGGQAARQQPGSSMMATDDAPIRGPTPAGAATGAHPRGRVGAANDDDDERGGHAANPYGAPMSGAQLRASPLPHRAADDGPGSPGGPGGSSPSRGDRG